MKNKISLALRLVIAIIFLQTLYFKFTAAPESVYIFQTLGAEPAGRLASGVLELMCAMLLLHRRTMMLGVVGSMGIIAVALLSHLFVLGIEVNNDGGLLFALAIVVFVCSALLLYLNRAELSKYIHRK